MATFSLPGGDLNYCDLGAGPPLLLIHGWPVSSEYWRPNLARLSERFRVLAIDLPGFGKSYCAAGEGCKSFQQAHRVAHFIRSVAGGPVHVVGHSMGGLVAAHLAAAEPSLVRRLVLVTAPLEGATGLSAIAMLARYAPIRWLASLLLKVGLVRRHAAPWFSHAVGVPDEILVECATASTPSVRLALQALTNDGSRYDLAHIRCPTLAIAGDRDRIVSPLQPLLAKGWIPGCRLEVFRDCGHCPNIEYPEMFEKTVVEFLLEESALTRAA